MLAHNYDAAKRKDFLYMGHLVAITVLQGGPGLPLFNSAVTDFIVYGDVQCNSVACLPKETLDAYEKVLHVVTYNDHHHFVIKNCCMVMKLIGVTSFTNYSDGQFVL